MKQAIQLHIPEPCHENWDKMTASEQGRFCMSCQKQVVDFSLMTDKEIIDHLSKASGKTCGRLNDDQLNRVIQPQPGKKRYSFKYLWSLLITSTIISNRAHAQGEVTVKKVTCTNNRTTMGDTVVLPPRILLGKVAVSPTKSEVSYEVTGIVTNENNKPVPFASITFKNGIGVAADSTGRFHLKANEDVISMDLLISSTGYEPLETPVTPMAIKNMTVDGKEKTVVMDIGNVVLKEKVLKEITIIAAPVMSKRVTCSYTSTTTGMLISQSSDTLFTRVIDTIKSLYSRNNLKLYPNPVLAGNTFNMQFNVKDMGDYRIEFIDALGKVVLVKEITIAYKNQLQSFNSHDLKTGGTYFVRISGKQSKAVYNAKLVVQ